MDIRFVTKKEAEEEKYPCFGYYVFNGNGTRSSGPFDSVEDALKWMDIHFREDAARIRAEPGPR